MDFWNKFQHWITRFFTYPNMDHDELQNSYDEGKIQPRRVQQLIRFRQRVFAVALLILAIFILIEHYF